HGLALSAHHDFVAGLFKILHGDQTLVGTRRKQRRLIHQVRQIGAGESGRTAGDYRGTDTLVQWHLAHMHFKNLLASANIRQSDIDLAVETTRTQQCLVQNIGTVGGRDDNDAVITFETIHFHQQLVKCLLALIMAASMTTSTMTTYRINLVNKDNAG